jgi:hypothetical protein
VNDDKIRIERKRERERRRGGGDCWILEDPTVERADPWEYGFNQSERRSLPCVLIIHTVKPPFAVCTFLVHGKEN